MAAMEPLDVRSLVLYDQEDAGLLLGLALAILWQVRGKGWHRNVGQAVFIHVFIHSPNCPFGGSNQPEFREDVAECKKLLPSRELTYPTLGKGKSSAKCHFCICLGDMLVLWRVIFQPSSVFLEHFGYLATATSEAWQLLGFWRIGRQINRWMDRWIKIQLDGSIRIDFQQIWSRVFRSSFYVLRLQ